MTSFERFNGDPDFHNFLKLIQPDIKKIWQKSFIIKDSWGVIMNEGDSTDYHSHEGVHCILWRSLSYLWWTRHKFSRN